MSQPEPEQYQSRGAATAEVVALVVAQDAAREALTAQLVALATTAARAFTGWYDTAAITAWAADLARSVEVMQLSLARQTDAYLARVSSVLTGRHVRPVGAVDVSSLRREVTHPGAYGRVADVYRWQQSQWDQFAKRIAEQPTDAPLEPPTIATPVEAAASRAEQVAEMDTQLVTSRQSQKFYEQQQQVTGYRRVIHPEMSKSGACGLCIAASDRLYGPAELLPIHGHCACTTLPVYRHADPGSTLNAEDLTRFYGEAGSTNRRDLKTTRYQVDEHGELGPVLIPEGAKQRPHRKDRPAPRAKTLEERRAQVVRILSEQEGALPRVRRLAGSNPAVWGDYAGELEARVDDLRRQLAA